MKQSKSKKYRFVSLIILILFFPINLLLDILMKIGEISESLQDNIYGIMNSIRRYIVSE